MSGNANQKIKLLYLADILRRYSDEQHPLTAPALCAHLQEYGISAERKSIYADIHTLEDYGLDIIKTKTPAAGFFVASRQFELPEIYLLCDAVQSAGFITPGKTRELIEKLGTLISCHQAKDLQKRVFIDTRAKCDNEEIYYNIDLLSRAVQQGKKVSLCYRNKYLSEGKIKYTTKTLEISPYALMWENDHYYVVGNNAKYSNLMHLRLDRMKTVTILQDPVRPFTEVSKYRDFFDVADYQKKTFSMFGGELCGIELCCKEHLLDQVTDKFGQNLIFRRNSAQGTFTFSVNALVSDGLVGWILQFGADIEVKSPPALRQKIRDRLTTLQELYK